MDMCIHTCIDACIDSCMDVCTDVCMDVCMDVCIDVCVDLSGFEAHEVDPLAGLPVIVVWAACNSGVG